jgi:hypothetical protein
MTYTGVTDIFLLLIGTTKAAIEFAIQAAKNITIFVAITKPQLKEGGG